MTVVVQNRYFIHPGHHDDGLALRRRASDVRRDAGHAFGRIMVPLVVEPDIPNFIWECEFPDEAAYQADVDWATGSAEFTSVQGEFADIIDRFEKHVFRVTEG